MRCYIICFRRYTNASKTRDRKNKMQFVICCFNTSKRFGKASSCWTSLNKNELMSHLARSNSISPHTNSAIWWGGGIAGKE